jgi:hypothetical protein
MIDAMQTAKLSDAAYRLLHATLDDLRPEMRKHWRRIDNLQWFRRARLGLAKNDGTFGGPDSCRRVMQTTEAEICQYYA